MWSILNGTIVNCVTVIAGSGAGLLVGRHVSEKYHRAILNCLGLVTIGLGIDAAIVEFAGVVAKYRPPEVPAYGARLALVAVACLLVGGLLGTGLGIQARIEALGAWLNARSGRGDDHRFAEGFLTASVVFCVGPLTLLGCLQNGGPARDPSLLYIKSLLDGFCSIALASTMGLGVAFSTLVVLGFQGGMSLMSWAFIGGEPSLGVELMSTVGGYVLLATGLVLLQVKELPVANLLPGIFLPPAAVAGGEYLVPGVFLGTG